MPTRPVAAHQEVKKISFAEKSLLAVWLLAVLALALMYHISQRSVLHSAEQALREKATQLASRVQQPLAQAQNALDSIQASHEKKSLDGGDLSYVETQLWAVMQQYKGLAQVHWAASTGQVIEIERLPVEGGFKAIVSTRPTPKGKRIQYIASQPLMRQEKLGEDTVDYDVFLQPWWKASEQRQNSQGSGQWSEPQVNSVREQLSVYLAQSLYLPRATSNRQALGAEQKSAPLALASVAAVQVRLSDINELLKGGKLPERSVAYVVDGKGHALASSERFRAFTLLGGKPDLVQAIQSESDLMQHAARLLAEHRAKVSNLPDARAEPLVFGAEGLLLLEQRIPTASGLNWSLVMAVATADHTAPLLRTTIGLATLLSAIALGLLWWLRLRLRAKSGHIQNNLQRLQDQMTAQDASHQGVMLNHIQQSNEDRAYLEKIRDELILRASHELNTPLHAISSAAQLLSQTALDREQRELVNILTAGSGELNRALKSLYAHAQDQDKNDEGRAANTNTVEGNTSQASLDESTAKRWPLRILLVDDNGINLKIGHLLLKRLGYRGVQSALDGQQAVTAVREALGQGLGFDLVLMDMQMPVMDGLQATAAIVEMCGVENKRVPYIVALTANAVQADRSRGLAAGLNDYLNKPIEIDQLQHVLEQAFTRLPPLAISQATASASVASVAHTSAAVVDFKRLDQLKQYDTDGSLIRDALSDFRTQLPQTVALLRESTHRGDFESARQAAHKIKGSASNLGAIALSSIADLLETAARENDQNSLLEGIPELNQSMEVTLEALNRRYH